MSPHLAIALSALLVAGWIDFRTRRIPNKLLLVAIATHLSLWILLGRPPTISVLSSLVYLILVIVLILWRRFFLLIERHIGMGDIKIIGYWIAFISPFVAWNRWFLSIALMATLILVNQRLTRSKEERVPFAPILLGATLLTLIPL